MAKIDILPDGMTIRPSEIAEFGGCPVSYRIKGKTAKLLAENNVKGIVSSYPVYKGGKCYDLTIDFDEDIVWYELTKKGGRGFFDSEYGCGKAPKKEGYEKPTYDYDLFDIVVPMIMRLKQEYDLMVEKTTENNTPMLLNECRNGEEYECWHAFEDLVVEGLVFDTDTMTITMEMGS